MFAVIAPDRVVVLSTTAALLAVVSDPDEVVTAAVKIHNKNFKVQVG